MKKLLAGLVCMGLLLCVAPTMFAAPYEASSITLTPSATQLKRGDTFTIVAELANEEEVNLVTVFLNYEDGVFEMTGGSCLVPNAMIGMVVPAEKSGVCMLGSAAVVSGRIYTFNMKVKEDAPVGTHNILNKRSVLGIGTGTEIVGNHIEITIDCPHAFGQWVQGDATKHKKVCTEVGCSHTIQQEHNFGTLEHVNAASHKRVCSETSCAYEQMQPHTYDKQVITDAYKATNATSTAEATYYYSCSCGAKGTQTFANGSVLKHVYNQQVVNDAYKATEATCTAKATYFYSCDCGAKGTQTFANGSVLKHAYNQQVVNDAYKATEATCTAKATYFYSCDCGAKSTDTFAYGELAEHTYGKWESDVENHWQICTCGTKSEVAKHAWDAGKLTAAPTASKEGERTYTCNDCGAVRREVVDKIDSQNTNDHAVLLPVILVAGTVLLGILVYVIYKKKFAH